MAWSNNRIKLFSLINFIPARVLFGLCLVKDYPLAAQMSAATDHEPSRLLHGM